MCSSGPLGCASLALDQECERRRAIPMCALHRACRSDEEPIMVEQQVFYTSPFGGAPQQASRSQARDLHACDNTTFAPNILPYVRLAR
eukprot:1583713-Pleurochrysis_carterae.AAC.1